MKKGFTLIEVLVAVALLGIFSVATTQVFLSMVRTQTKTESVQEVKQSGDYAFTVMETMIRNAKAVSFPDCVQGTEIQITNPDNEDTIFSCESDHIASKSALGLHPDLNLTGANTKVSACLFTVVCPTSTSGSTSKYVYFSYSIQPTGAPSGDPLQSTTQMYQGTVTIRNE